MEDGSGWTPKERKTEIGKKPMKKMGGGANKKFTILNSYEDIGRNIFFVKIKAGKINRGPNMIVVKEQSRLDVRKYSFSQRTIKDWNEQEEINGRCIESPGAQIAEKYRS